MTNKVFWFDLETSGLDHNKHGIIELAGIIDIDGQIEDTINMEIKPAESCEIDNDALRVNNYTHREIETFSPESLAFKNLGNIFTRHVDRYNSDDKMWVGGYNVNFDIDFLTTFWDRNKSGKHPVGSYLKRSFSLDPYGMIPPMVDNGIIDEPNAMNLKYACKMYMDDYDCNWHSAMDDVIASRDLYYELQSRQP